MRGAFPVRQTKTGTPGFTKVFPIVNKTTLRDAVLQELRQELARQSAAAALARDEAISEESRAENKWDTHSQEAAYLAEGQAKLALEIGSSIALYETLPLPDFGAGATIGLGAVVELAADGSGNGPRACYFLGPRAGGLEVSVEGRKILVVTSQSPIGRQLLGKQVGDAVPSSGRGAGETQRIATVE